ncbi:hypothetical protein [Acinetobacter baumannii]|uniref:hypothetical protein n=2 Tax=Acinetobacter baumannii TaxID=470 RepID=UPI00059B31A8|nr:hypothetical protein [Acinetobacter baumannii]MBF6690374.1 hypothetical protein [Acinetobacter baumannii]MBF6699255.1 hypothetical protein [Acinetobacter baumannii]MBF6706130.1 hypothetical protein [Acinetobacter baumannii]MBF6775577.1 hypothetical protein [Acinetobacter baumannii]MBF6814940.1 hypothetical protein [Acinetobacter baumannii]
MSKALAYAPAVNTAKTNLPSNESDPFYGSISKHKYAEFSLCDKEGNPIAGSPVIRALLTDGDKSIESQWQTPFENSNPELKMPMLMAGLQSGQLSQVAEQMQSNPIAQVLSKLGVQDAMQSVEGRTNLTKVNTTQVFLSTSSVRLNLSIFFLAFSDAKTEVEDRIMQLEAWSLPVSLSSDSTLQNVVNDSNTTLEGLFSGVIPPFVSLTTHGKTYKPFILESVSAPIVAPIDEKGNRLSLAVNISLLSRTAWDSKDIYSLYGVK